jgi:hypothetical protein
MLQRIRELAWPQRLPNNIPLFAPDAIERIESYQDYCTAKPHSHFLMDGLFNPDATTWKAVGGQNTRHVEDTRPLGT